MLVGLAFLVVGIWADCLSNPSTANCTNYEMPTAMVDSGIQSVCSEMPNMLGCSFLNYCEDSANDVKNEPFCGTFAVYKILCLDMGSMQGCTSYRTMCGTGTAVLQCQMPVPDFPKTLNVESDLESMCNSHAMETCQQYFNCSAGGNTMDCNLLELYSSVCLSMPEMDDCADWQTMCEDVGNWSFCTADVATQVPIMRMYFHTGELDYILFKGWVPRSSGIYALSWLGIFLIAIFYEIFKSWKRWYLLRLGQSPLRHLSMAGLRTAADFDMAARTNGWKVKTFRVDGLTCNSCQEAVATCLRDISSVEDVEVKLDGSVLLASSQRVPRKVLAEALENIGYGLGTALSEASQIPPFWLWVKRHRFNAGKEVQRAALQFVEVNLSLALMLIAMTFNVGLYLAVVLGAAVGSFLISGRVLNGVESGSACH